MHVFLVCLYYCLYGSFAYVICWALIFILRLRFPPGSSLASILNYYCILYIHSINYIVTRMKNIKKIDNNQ